MKRPEKLPANVWRQRIQRDDWDFSKSACPDENLFWCLVWEYLRELVQSKHGGTFPPPRASEPGGWAFTIGPVTVLPSGFIPHPDFPKHSYIQQWRESGRPNPKSDVMAKLDWFNYLDVNIWEFLRDYGDKPEHKIRGEPIWEGGIFKKEIVPLSIPWALPDEIIVDYFRQFLEVYRPQGDDQRPRVDAPRFRGKTGGAGSEPRQHRAVLKALGAWRLYQHYDGNFVKASLNREAMVFLGKQYELAGPWYHAKKTVQSVLRQFQSEIDRAIREKP